MTQSKDDKNPVIPFDAQIRDLYELAQDKAMDANWPGPGFDFGFAHGVMHTLDWLRGEAPYPFDGTGGAELEESPGKRELAPSLAALFHPGDA